MHPAKFYLIFVLLPQLLIAPFFAFRPERSNFRWTNYTFFTFITLLSLFAILDPHLKSEIPDIDPVLGTAVGGSLFNALHMLLLVDPLTDYRHTTDVFDSTKELPWWKRIYWAACANFAIRGIDWNFQVPHIVTQKHRNRPTFVFYALSRTLIFFILSDVAQYLGSKFRSEDSALGKSKVGIIPSGFIVIHAPLQLSSLTQLTFQIIRTICWGMEDFANLSRLYYCIAIISVSGHLSSPDEWPPLFGSWSEAYCLRNFWG
ncbi:hypothetical protein D9757_004429 [Collybiopsis confluens]|uniref:Wax synthase domain-containing protein n=1 Tax=Collybiopsis confluens TaxID=2823264 RepID=A0A8H5MDV5_9AGAR|nr:hypothetical protein D9757_004429 [Collybiopsis confluens]